LIAIAEKAVHTALSGIATMHSVTDRHTHRQTDRQTYRELDK